MIKILFVIPNLGQGGAEKVLVNLVNNMNSEMFDVTLMTLYDEGENKEFLSKKIKYKTCFKSSFKGVAHVLKIFSPKILYSKFIKDHYDIVVSYLEGQTARIVSGCQDTNTKTISWIHVEQHTKKQMARVFRNIKEMEKCYKSFDYTVCVSEFVKKDFSSMIPVENISVLYNTIESNKIRELAEEKIEKNMFAEEEIKICGIGTLKKSKGFDRLLRTHYRLRKEGYQVHTYILGKGPELKNLKKLVKELQIEESVTFLGYKKNPYKYLKNSDIFVCTSFAEGFSTAATEALILGRAVCTVEVSGMQEMLGRDNEYGIITQNDEEEFYKGLKLLVKNKEKLQYYKKQATIRGKQFDTENTVNKVEELFLEILGE